MAMAHKFNPDEQAKLSGFFDYYINSTIPPNKIWRPVDNVTHSFRILPPWSARGATALQVFRYYQRGLQQLSFVSPTFFGEEDPFLATKKLMWRIYKDEKSNKDFMWDYNQIGGSDLFYYNVIVNSEKEKGPQVWGAIKDIHVVIAAMIQGGEYGLIFDEEEGRNLTMMITRQGLKPTPVVLPAGHASKLENLEWCSQLHDLDKAIRKPNVDDVWACYETIPWKYISVGNGLLQMREAPQTVFGLTKVQPQMKDDIPTSWPAADTTATPFDPTAYKKESTAALPSPVPPQTTDSASRFEETKRIQAELRAAREAEKLNK